MKRFLILLQVLGFSLFVGGVFFFRWDGPQDERVEHLPLSTTADVSAAPPGETLLIEGRINSDTIPFDNGLVAYDYQCRGATGNWSFRDKTTTTLRVTLPDGVVTVNEGFYPLLNPSRIIPAPNPPEERPGCRSFAYHGLGVDDEVVVIGTVGPDGHIAPDMLYGGDRAGLLASTRQATLFHERGLRLLGVGIATFTLAFGLMLVVDILGGIWTAWWKVLRGGR